MVAGTEFLPIFFTVLAEATQQQSGGGIPQVTGRTSRTTTGWAVPPQGRATHTAICATTCQAILVTIAVATVNVTLKGVTADLTLSTKGSICLHKWGHVPTSYKFSPKFYLLHSYFFPELVYFLVLLS